MIKKLVLLFIFLFTFTFYLLPSKVLADDAFIVDAVVTYKIDNSGKTVVTHDITLENLFSTLYATTYTLSLENIDAQNIVAVNDKGNPIHVDQDRNNNRLAITLTFADSVVGRGAKRNFKVSYDNSGFATKTGEVWEISIPKLSSDSSYRHYSVNFLVPNSFGQEAYISPQPTFSSIVGDYTSYSFSKESISATGVTAGFGQFQVFSFNLSYHLENPLALNSQTEIALPPDTAFQKIYIDKLSPKPSQIRTDEDGNWLAVYKLSPRQRMDVNVEGSVQIFASFRHFPKPDEQTLINNLKPTNYWQSDSEKIKLLAQSLKTPEAIYSFVTTNLMYDTTRVQPNLQRLGALAALDNSKHAICMEFTDLFIAIARAAGIPAREINGYAYTENKDLQPLSLVSDVLHAWPEYYDAEKDVWIPIDPTWGATSGVDYFSKLDLRHFSFVIHGKSDKEPYPPGSYKLGVNPQKDVFVSFGQLPEKRNSVPDLSLLKTRSFPFFGSVYTAKIVNPGPISFDNLYSQVLFDDKLWSSKYIQSLPPFANYEFQIKIPFSLLGKNTPNIIKLTADTTEAVISTNKVQIVTNSLLILSVLLILIVLAILIRLRKIHLTKIIAILARINAKFK